MQIAYTTVYDNGNHEGGYGISETEKKATGAYYITYDPGFASSPGVSATPWASGVVCSVNVMATNMCEVRVTDLRGVSVDAAFVFLAVCQK